jgi:hypothetical protein
MSTYDLPHLLIWLIIIVIFLVIIFWLLDHFLFMSLPLALNSLGTYPLGYDKFLIPLLGR